MIVPVAAALCLPTIYSLEATASSLRATVPQCSPRAMQSRAQGSRLKPVTDSLENVGFVSKGDRKYGDY